MCAICNFKLDFSVGHPLALSVAVAARRAIEAGLIEPVDAAGAGALSAARMRMSAVEALNLLQARIEDAHSEQALLAIPDFYVLLIENDTWGFFHATTEGFDPDIVPDMPDVATTDEAKRSNIIVTSEAGLRAWLDGRLDIGYALRESLLVVDAPVTFSALLTQMLTAAGSATIGAH
ncbi:hypothetical protein [Paraburkholderia sp. ZP32-5]|uniref:hypothetical protein n=1 Tax=Paraburkholderia sp. ZP32-5 TaxID=2883245 RepID=UPI001F30F8FA|nr:hypothetical protein [Paraburkholderia sp. ZP32-5]